MSRRRRQRRSRSRSPSRDLKRQLRSGFRHGARRFTPPGLAGRIILLVVAIVALVQLVSWAFEDDEGWRMDEPEEVAAAQVVSATALLDRTPPQDRDTLAEALSGLSLQVSLDDRPATSSSGGRWFREAEQEVREALDDLGDRPLTVSLSGDGGRDSALVLSVQLSDGDWVIYRFPLRAFMLLQREGSGIGSVLFWLFIAGMVFWFSNRLARPLRTFASAAERLGRDVNTDPLPETGSRELRRAAKAFNQMQMRVQRMIDDRALMLAAIAHDLRTVLTRLRLRAEFIEDAEQHAKAEADIEEMQAMLDAGLAFARGETEVEERRRIDLAQLVRDMTEDFARTDGPATYSGPDHLYYRCGPNEIRRAVANLIRNAIHYGKQADVHLASGADGVRLTIRDQGPGIAADLQEKVFQPFYRVEGSRNRETGGTGLGLAIARTIARRHGGDINLTNPPGGGLAATLILPQPRV